jgi:TIR domain
MQERRAVFPIADSGGDAATAFAEIGQRWHAAGVWGISHSTFERVLGRKLSSEQAAGELADDVMLLIADHLAFKEAESARGKLFISYARSDRAWLAAVKTQLAALLEQSIEVWDDSEIPPGSDFERAIQRAIGASRASLLLVTPKFLDSSFIQERELPFLLRAHDNDLLQIFWVHIQRSPYEATPLGKLQASHDPKRPIAEMSPSEQREAIAQICLQVARSIKR